MIRSFLNFQTKEVTLDTREMTLIVKISKIMAMIIPINSSVNIMDHHKEVLCHKIEMAVVIKINNYEEK